MISFPYDSIMTVDEDTKSVNLDRAINSKVYRRLLSKYFTTGVFSNPETGFQVLANEKEIIVKAGAANVNGVYVELEDDLNINITDYMSSTSNVTLGVIIRHDDSLAVRSSSIKILNNAGDDLPALTRNETIYDIAIAKITIPAGAMIIYQSYITDLRLNTAYCGIVSSSIKTIDTTTFYNQIQSDLSEFKSDEKLQFQTWFDSIKDELSTDQAGNLQNQINYVRTLVNNVSYTVSGLLDKMYPVGSIYLSVNNTNPQDFIGGTWVRWGNGRVPVGIDTTDTDFNTVEKTGGEKKHMLTTQELAKHYHKPAASLPVVMHKQTPTVAQTSFSLVYDSTERNQFYEDEECSGMQAGGNQPHNNLQPYITCYMWKRLR